VRALGAAVRERRIGLRLTRVELARRSRLAQARIIRVEDGDPDIDLLQLVAIAGALEIPLRRLLQRAERQVGRRAQGKRRISGRGIRGGGNSSAARSGARLSARSKPKGASMRGTGSKGESTSKRGTAAKRRAQRPRA
jgi:transcriptional regulator with XRE-family HTH domain